MPIFGAAFACGILLITLAIAISQHLPFSP